jgi:hypothetical protein
MAEVGLRVVYLKEKIYHKFFTGILVLIAQIAL